MKTLRRLYCACIGHDWDYGYCQIDGSDVRLCYGCGVRQIWNRPFKFGAYLPGRWMTI